MGERDDGTSRWAKNRQADAERRARRDGNRAASEEAHAVVERDDAVEHLRLAANHSDRAGTLTTAADGHRDEAAELDELAKLRESFESYDETGNLGEVDQDPVA